jgi:DNA-binding CsgD family transcriptional regulator
MPDFSAAIVGRRDELATIEQFLDLAHTGPSALVLEGEPGIGKTTLWSAAVEAAAARDFCVLSSQPAQAEAKLPNAALADLLSTVAEEVLPSLASPQRRALKVALLRIDPEGTEDHRAVGVAFLSALEILASHGPVALAVDDLQWLDKPSARAVAFALRRLRGEPVHLLASLRVQTDTSAPVGLDRAINEDRTRRVRVGPLTLAALHHVLKARVGTSYPRSALIAIHKASGGNPFFAIELGRALRESGQPGLDPLPVPERLQELVTHNLRRLPRTARGVLLIAAVLADPRVDVVEAAAATPDPPSALSRAEDSGAITVDHGRIRFSHPLLASVLYSSARPGQRRDAHRRLAGIIEDPVERAGHLSRAVVSPDESTASALEEAASLAYRRGAPDVAADLAERAGALTPPDAPDAARRRAVVGAQYRQLSGDVPGARRLLEDVVATTPEGTERADVLIRLALAQDRISRGAELCEQALMEAGQDPATAASAHRAAGYFTTLEGDHAAALAHAEQAVSAGETTADRSLVAAALGRLGYQRFMAGQGVQTDLFERALALEPPELRDQPNASPSAMYAITIMNSDRLDEARTRLRALLLEARARGAEASAAQTLFYLAQLETWAGNFELGAEYATERLDFEPYDHPTAPLYIKAYALACLGHVEDARAAAEEGRREAERRGGRIFVMQNLHALGFLELSGGDFQAAHEHLGPAGALLRSMSLGEFGPYRCLPDEIECLVGLGALDEARDHLVWMERIGEATERPWTLAVAGRCRALLQAAEGLQNAALATANLALEWHERLPMPLERARTLLVKGAVLRRLRRRRDAREAFQEALGIFERLHAPVWGSRARSEIARIGIRTEAQQDLTPIEQRIALLALAGGTNRQVADALFISHKTVEANLSRIYRKLGISTRAQLGPKLAERHRAGEGNLTT